MNERWVCKRCFADNEEAAGTCGRCGWMRGAEASDADRAAWVAQGGDGPAVAEPEPGWRRYARFWWIPAIAIFLAVGFFTQARRGDDGELVSAGSVGVDALQVGDCFNTGDETQITDVDGVPCAEPHAYEVFAVLRHEGELPVSDIGMQSLFLELCADEFSSYVGTSWASSMIYGSMISPSEESYDQGDREYICVLYEPDPGDPSRDRMLTESLRGANR